MTATPSIDLPAWMVEQLSQASPDLLRQMVQTFRESVDVGRCRRGVRLRAAQPGPQQHPQRLSASGLGHPRRHYRPGHPQATGSELLPEWLLQRRRRAESALVSVVATCYLLGVSTRRMDSKRSAEQWLTLMEGRILRGEWQPPEQSKIMFGGYATHWVADRRLEPWSREL